MNEGDGKACREMGYMSYVHAGKLCAPSPANRAPPTKKRCDWKGDTRPHGRNMCTHHRMTNLLFATCTDHKGNQLAHLLVVHADFSVHVSESPSSIDGEADVAHRGQLFVRSGTSTRRGPAVRNNTPPPTTLWRGRRAARGAAWVQSGRLGRLMMRGTHVPSNVYVG
eukprot:3345543-Pleurochrysis_carterae.AAC.4